MLLNKLARIFISLALLSLQAVNCQGLVETVGQFIPPSTSSVDGKSIKSAIEAEFLINFFEKLDSETFDSASPEINKAAKKIASRTAEIIAKGLKNSDLELSTKEKLFVCNQLKFMTTLLLRINGLSDQCKQDILKAHRLINTIFNQSFFSKTFDFIYAQKNKAFTLLGLVSATFGTLAAFHAFKILKTTDQCVQDIQKVSELGASACQTASEHPENLAAGLGAGIDVLAAKDKELEKIIGAFKKSDKEDGLPPIVPAPPKKGPFEMIESLVNNQENHPLIEKLATTLGSQAIKLGLAPKPQAKNSKSPSRKVVLGRKALKQGLEPKQESPITEAFGALEKNSRTRRRMFHTIEEVGKRLVTEVAPQIPDTVAAYSSKAAPQQPKAKEKGKAKEPSSESDEFDSGDESSDADSTDSCRVDDDEESQFRPLGSSSSSSSSSGTTTAKKKKVRFRTQQKEKDPQSMFSQITTELEKNPNMRAELIDAGKEIAKEAVKTSPQIATTMASAGLHAAGSGLYNAGASVGSGLRSAAASTGSAILYPFSLIGKHLPRRASAGDCGQEYDKENPDDGRNNTDG